ncbi:MAG: hypothetical protein QM501_00935 [Gimesia sp.]
MSSKFLCIITTFLMGSVWNHCVFAQQIRVQQPVVQQFSTQTTVSVPDRGSIVLGAFNSGSIRSRQVGPFRRGGSYGQAFQSSTSSVGVYIHDFEAMDQMLLNSAPAASKYMGRNFQANQAHWKQQLFTQRALYPDLKHSSNTLDGPQNLASIQKKKTQDKAERFFKLGQNAEEKHATPNIAILHYRVAAKYGSTKATTRLQKLRNLKK